MTTCTQRADDGCATDPDLGTCPACGFILHDIPSSAESAHDDLCCGGAAEDCDGDCATHPRDLNREGDPAFNGAFNRW